MASTALNETVSPTLSEVRQRIVARQRALARIPKPERFPQVLSEPVIPHGLAPHKMDRPRIRGLFGISFCLPQTTQQVGRSSWLAECLTAVMMLLNIAAWGFLLLLW